MAALRMRRVLVLVVVVVLAMAMILPVYADKPVVTIVEAGLSVLLPGGEGAWPCEDFAVTFVETGPVRETRWLNSEGLVVKGFSEYGGVEAYFTANGRTLRANSVSPIHYTAVYNAEGTSDWTYTVTGPDFRVVLPRTGAVIGLAGRQSWVNHCPGEDECDNTIQWSFTGLAREDLAAFCAALAPQ